MRSAIFDGGATLDFFGVAAGEVIQPLVERTTHRRISMVTQHCLQ